MLKKSKIIFIVAAVLVVILLIFFFGYKKSNVEYVTADVTRGQLLQTVSETGVVKASQEINLNFLNSGQIGRILVEVGAKVKKDQILAELDYSALAIKEVEAQANLNKVVGGATREEVAVKQASVNQAESAYSAAVKDLDKAQNTVEENISQAKQTLADLTSSLSTDITPSEKAIEVYQTSLNNAKSSYSQAIKNKEDAALTVIDSKIAVANTALDKIYSIITDTDAKDVLSVKNTNYLVNTEATRNSAVLLSVIADTSLAAAKNNMTEANINKALDDTINFLNKVFTSLNFCFNALEYTVYSSSYTQTELNTDKASISTNLTNISSAITSVQTANQDLKDARLSYDTNVASAEGNLAKARVDLDNAIVNARNALNTAQISGDQQISTAEAKIDSTREARDVARAELARVTAPARSEDVALYKAALDSVKKQIENSIIKAPIDGTITKINYEVGEQARANEAVVSMLGQNNFEIEIDISEADISKVNVGNKAEVTLDAFGEDVVFSGEVYFMEPAETVIQDVIYYKVKISFDLKEGYDIKSGMTANALITTAKKDNILLIPSRAVIQKNGKDKLARVLVNGEIKEVPIRVGLRGDGGIMEVVSGVKEGDKVVTFIKESK